MMVSACSSKAMVDSASAAHARMSRLPRSSFAVVSRRPLSSLCCVAAASELFSAPAFISAVMLSVVALSLPALVSMLPRRDSLSVVRRFRGGSPPVLSAG